MKNLLYKELKLSMHPLCCIFALSFGTLALIPNYPLFVSTIYVITSYTILFLGANKGQTTNDLFYTLNLPIKRNDVVKARLLSLSFLQFLTICSSTLFAVISIFIYKNSPIVQEFVGLNIEHIIVFIGLVLIGYSITDLIYCSIFYNTGKSLIASSLISIIFYVTFGFVFMIFLPIQIEPLRALCSVKSGIMYILYQLLFLLFSILVYVILRIITNKICTKKLLKLDF